MNCRSFEIELADWVKGILSPEDVARMESHAATCSRCMKAEGVERTMFSAFQAIPEPREAPDLWARIAARLEEPERKPRFSLWPRQLARVGSLALAGALCGMVLIYMNPMVPVYPKIDGGRGTVSPTVVEMVGELQKLPDPDSEGLNSEVHNLRQQQQFVLLGGAR